MWGPKESFPCSLGARQWLAFSASRGSKCESAWLRRVSSTMMTSPAPCNRCCIRLIGWLLRQSLQLGDDGLVSRAPFDDGANDFKSAALATLERLPQGSTQSRHAAVQALPFLPGVFQVEAVDGAARIVREVAAAVVDAVAHDGCDREDTPLMVEGGARRLWW